MRTIPFSAITVPVILTLAACGGGGKDQGSINSSTARASIDSIGDVSAAMAAGNAEGAASGVMALTAAGQSVVAPEAPRQVMGLLPARWPRALEQALTGSASCTETACTFDNFGDDTTEGSWRINGTTSYSGDTLAFDLTYDITSSGFDFHWELDGQVTITPTLIDGEVHSHGTATGDDLDGYSIDWDVDVIYDAIGLDGSACPVSGSLYAAVSYDVSGSGGSGGYAVEGRLSFGPACGQYTAN